MELKYVAGRDIKLCMVVYLHETGFLIPYDARSKNPLIGMAARDIKAGETVKSIIGGNTEDIITKGSGYIFDLIRAQ